MASGKGEIGLRALLGAVLWLAATAVPALAQSDDANRAKAKAAFEQGVADYDAGRYPQALSSFQEAMRLRPHPLVEVNIANCYEKLHQPIEAIGHFERFMSSDIGTPEQRKEVTAALVRLKQQVGKLLLRITPDGAEVVIDQEPARRAPISEPIALLAGDHEIEVTAEGYKSVRRGVSVNGASTLELSINLEPQTAAETAEAAPAPSAVPSPAPTAPAPEAQPQAAAAAPAQQEEHGGPPAGAWVAGGVTLALGLTAIITGAIALKANSQFKQDRTARFDPTVTTFQRQVSYEDARSDASRARAFAVVTDVALGAGLVSAIVTVYLLAHHSDASSEAAGASARLAPALRRDGAGVSLHAAF